MKLKQVVENAFTGFLKDYEGSNVHEATAGAIDEAIKAATSFSKGRIKAAGLVDLVLAGIAVVSGLVGATDVAICSACSTVPVTAYMAYHVGGYTSVRRERESLELRVMPDVQKYLISRLGP